MMNINKLLFITDFEELWFDALNSLMDLRNAGLNHVVFLHVIEREKVAMHRGTGYLKDVEVRLKEMANVRFINWAESLFEKGMECGAYIVIGDPVSKAVSAAKEEEIDLIVTGRHQKGRFEELYASSETIELLRRTATPVMVHKYMLKSGKVNERPFEKPLLAIDWSPSSKKALEFLISIKDAIQKAEIIHVLSEKEIKGLSKTEMQKMQKSSKKRLEETRDTLEREGINSGSHLYIGDVASQIEKAAYEQEATMVILGTTGKSSLKERFLGSVS
ncbi:MAG: universal stress protein, partial [Thermodesulfobacteriota bacterium]|nr:universal stress protein [Thermodesulfobacteriota bacterium]